MSIIVFAAVISTWVVIYSNPIQAETTTTSVPTTTSCGLEDGATCTSPTECCSQACSAVPNGGFTCGGCLATAEACTTNAECCNNDCDTTSGQCNAATTTTTTTSTLASCGLEDGEVCTSPADCCSLDCTLFNGVPYCGGCLKLGATCAAGTDCCSGTCDPTLNSCVN